MAVVSMKRNRFKVVFEDSQNTQFDLDYSLNDNLVADKWFKKIKHLKDCLLYTSDAADEP